MIRAFAGGMGPRPPTPSGPRDVGEALDHELLPKNIEGTRAQLKRLLKLDVLTEDDALGFARKR
ncbi:hypothetical protein [Streptomyces sp. NPDC014995]|uniref:hypothetical protein n=1 Tax=Streptomyces sp. NPDC014995 TaxID=3364936 RepID=UPI0036FBD1CF